MFRRAPRPTSYSTDALRTRPVAPVPSLFQAAGSGFGRERAGSQGVVPTLPPLDRGSGHGRTDVRCGEGGDLAAGAGRGVVSNDRPAAGSFGCLDPRLRRTD